jgi:hypothetical protein
MKAKDLFILAVRLLGLYFFYLGLKDLDVPALMDTTIIKGDNLDDIISTALPVLFNLAVAWWLLGSSFLTRRAYPESAKISDYFTSLKEPAAPASQPAQTQALTDLEVAEKKLAALVGKPKDGPAPRAN